MQNSKIQSGELPDAVEIKLESVLIGNGWYDPSLQHEAYYNYTVSPGNTYDYKPFNESIDSLIELSLYGIGNCLDLLKSCEDSGQGTVCEHAADFCHSNVELSLYSFASRDPYDIRQLINVEGAISFPYGDFFGYLTTDEVRLIKISFEIPTLSLF
jgi:carboxypeptidase D